MLRAIQLGRDSSSQAVLFGYSFGNFLKNVSHAPTGVFFVFRLHVGNRREAFYQASLLLNVSSARFQGHTQAILLVALHLFL